MNTALRKAAILVSALDPAEADQLLDQMGEQQAARVRNAVIDLEDVAAVEQEAVLAEFFGKSGSEESSDGGVELAISSSAAALPYRRSVPARTTQPFGFLHEAPGEELARRLRHEHPQLIALVVGHLSAEKSADLLEHLPRELREEVLNRLVELDDTDSEIILELETALQRMFVGADRGLRRSGPRHEHMQAILRHLGRKSSKVAASRQNVRTIERSAPRPLTTSGEVVRAAPPQIAFDQLLSLSAPEFFGVFEEADPRVVMLALAGAPRRMFERYLAQFSTERALEFERHLEQLRPLRLRDVEAAQRELATLAGRRWQAAKSAAEKSRRFAAAA